MLDCSLFLLTGYLKSGHGSNQQVSALQIGMTTNLGTNEFSRLNHSFLLPFVVKICKGQNEQNEPCPQVKQNQLDTGIQTCRQIIKQSPDNAGAWLWLGIALAKQGNKTAAQHCFQKAQTLGHPQAAKALSHLQQL